jgi:hypothetical protein
LRARAFVACAPRRASAARRVLLRARFVNASSERGGAVRARGRRPSLPSSSVRRPHARTHARSRTTTIDDEPRDENHMTDARNASRSRRRQRMAQPAGARRAAHTRCVRAWWCVWCIDARATNGTNSVVTRTTQDLN